MRFEIYKDANQQYRWRLLAKNSEVVADSGEGYVNLAECKHGITLVKRTNAATPIEVTE